MTDFFNTYVNHLALHVQSNKSVEQKTLHHTFRLFDICHLGVVLERIKLFEKMLTGSPFLSSCCFILFVNSLLAHFFRSSTLPKSLAQAEAFSDDYSQKLQLGTEWGGEEHLLRFASPLIPSSHPFFDCKILSIAAYFPPIIFLPFPPYQNP